MSKKNRKEDEIFNEEDYLKEIKYAKNTGIQADPEPADSEDSEDLNSTADVKHEDVEHHDNVREKLLEEMEGIDDMEEKSLTREILENKNFMKYQIILPVKDVVSMVQTRLGNGISVLAQDMPYVNFYNLYLEQRAELSPAERQILAREYYPSTVANSTGWGVSKLIRLDVPKSAIAGTGDQASNKLFWNRSEDLLQKFAKTYPELFGTAKFIPGQEILENGYYIMYACTLPTVLTALGVDTKLIKELNIDIKIATYSTKNTLAQEDFYVVEFCKL